jgi:hypothetical protein
MNYCSIDDAWNNSEYITNQFKNYDNPYTKKKSIENFSNNDKNNTNNMHDMNEGNNMNTQYLNNQQYINSDVNSDTNSIINNEVNAIDYNNVFICDDFWDHINTCKVCRTKVRDRFSSKIIEKFENIVLDNKDTIVVFLVCLFALIFCNLLITIINR